MTNERQPSKHTVILFDPNKDASVAEALKAEQKRDPKVVGIKAVGEFGLVETPKGVFFLDSDGVGEENAVTTVPVEFYRHFKEADGSTSFEPIPFATARFSVQECKALKVGEKPLHLFIKKFGFRLEANYNMWETFLNSQTS